MSEFRALYTQSHNWEDVRISGVGVIGVIGHGPQFVPKDELVRYDDPGMAPVHTTPVILYSKSLTITGTSGYSIGQSPWGFPIHASCWKISNWSMDAEPSTNIAYLTSVCRCLPLVIIALLGDPLQVIRRLDTSIRLLWEECLSKCCIRTCTATTP
ncbi:hypothetical protein K491DRAFT_697622 [Lophiostoma macrostomum CBS 122681]|uniref:Uncharacterized protein n=1 Tax=Lophiostoma macrostomum CBS 122681 TaxID=1314788 RepID=A0A6A6SQY3_9PLEO|nr:hypothetical protein K491DRAFT_697622 [Lophiostoma macrostomum CBS 122681]